MKPLLLDTGVIVALLDRGDQYHQVCSDYVRKLSAPLLTCEAVIAESCYLLRHVPGATDAILANVEAGIFQIPVPLFQAAARIRQLFRKYRNREVDLADACLIQIAEQMGIGDILTIDRDFEVYRWNTNKRFRVLIPLH